MQRTLYDDDGKGEKKIDMKQMFNSNKCVDLFRDIDQLDQIKPTKELIAQYVKTKVQRHLKVNNLKKIVIMIKSNIF